MPIRRPDHDAHARRASLRLVAGGLLLATVPVLLAPRNVSAQHGGEIIEVPLAMTSNHLSVPVTAADGTVLNFMLSTGTPITLVSESAAAANDPAALTMGGIPIAEAESRVIPDARLEVDGYSFDGIVAATVLPDYDVLLDVPNGRMLLRPLGPAADWAGVTLGDPVTVRVFHGVVLATDIQLNGHDYMAQVEIGINKIIVNGPVTTALGFEGETTGTVTLGGREFTEQPVHHIEVDAFERWDPDGNGFVLLGAPVARDCAIAISWVRGELRVCAQ